jgi:hypothetical protein
MIWGSDASDCDYERHCGGKGNCRALAARSANSLIFFTDVFHYARVT